MNFGILGFGLMGQQRARSLAQLPGQRLLEIYDPDLPKARAAESRYGCRVALSATELLENPDIECVIVALPHHLTAEAAVAAIQSGKYVFCEKPLGRNVHECKVVLQANERRRRLGVGFNYRFYPAIQAAKRLIAEHAIGELTHVRCALGHGGRPGYENEWKTDRIRCGGGALLDPGIHAIDLIRFFFGEIVSGTAHLFRSFWPVDVEDNAFLALELERGRYAQMHISITEWKSRFAFDLFGTGGAVRIRGRSGFYGAQVLHHDRRWGWMEQPPVGESVTEYPPEDCSFSAELAEYIGAITGGDAPSLAGEADAIRALEAIEALYRENEPVPAIAARAGPL